MIQAVNSNKDFSAKKLKGSEQQKKLKNLLYCVSPCCWTPAGLFLPTTGTATVNVRQRGKSESENI